MDMQSAIRRVIERRDLSGAEMEAVMRLIMTGQATDAQIGGLLVGLSMKGETVEEIAGAARVMRELATPVHARSEHLVDIVGTGGDSSSTFNISTASCFVVAAAGGHVAKHGNRSVSSRSGAADVLEAAGVNLDVGPEVVAACVDEIGVGFMFAPRHHGAMKYAVGPRKEMGVRTMFNLLGPLTNPAAAPDMLLGVFGTEWLEPMALTLRELDAEHVLVVRAEDGLDEISIAAPTRVAELRDGEVVSYRIRPQDLGVEPGSLDSLRVEDAAGSLAILQSVLAGDPGPAQDIVALNAGAAIYAAGLAEDLRSGVGRAREVILSGAARAKLDALVEMTNSAAGAEDQGTPSP